MAEFMYRCRLCGTERTTNWSIESLGDCETADCDGQMKRVWQVYFATQNLKEARK